MREFKFFQENDSLVSNVLSVGPLMFNPESFEPVRVILYEDEDGLTKSLTIETSHPLWDEIRERYP